MAMRRLRRIEAALLPATIALIVLGLGALAWEWHEAHATATPPAGAATHPHHAARKNAPEPITSKP